MSRKLLSTLAVLSLLLSSFIPSSADSIILQENFDTQATGTFTTGSSIRQFNITAGSVDVVNNGDLGLPCAGGAGRCVDLDGANATTTTLESQLGFDPGYYLVQFDLAGSQRGDSNTVVVSLADTSMTYTLPSDAPFATYSFPVTIPETFFVQSLKFVHGPSGDSNGLLLDNVVVTATSPPADRPWTTTGDAGATEDESNPARPTYTNFTASADSGSPAGSYILRYNIHATDNLTTGNASSTRLRVRFRDDGAGSQVTVAIRASGISGGVATLGTIFDSNAYPASANFQTQEITFLPVMFNFTENNYWLEVTLVKSSPANQPAFASAQISRQ